jgi:hypothetical protein
VRAADRGEDWAPTDEDFYQSFGRRWAAQHHLVIAAHQLQLWVERLVKERALRGRHDQMPDRDAVVENLRNALEHLNEADLDEGLFATAGEAPVKGRVGKNRSLRALGGYLLIGTDGTDRIFQHLQPDELQRRANDILTTWEEYEDYLLHEYYEDMRRE